MTLTDRQAAFLLAIFEDREHFTSLMPRYERGNTAVLREREDIEYAKVGLVRGDPGRWLGVAMTPSLYVMTSRCYAQLDAKGLIRRHANGYSPDRTSHLELTPEGERVARELADAGKEKLPPCVAAPGGEANEGECGGPNEGEGAILLRQSPHSTGPAGQRDHGGPAGTSEGGADATD